MYPPNIHCHFVSFPLAVKVRPVLGSILAIDYPCQPQGHGSIDTDTSHFPWTSLAFAQGRLLSQTSSHNDEVGLIDTNNTKSRGIIGMSLRLMVSKVQVSFFVVGLGIGADKGIAGHLLCSNDDIHSKNGCCSSK